jgi:hypothetical protein
MSAYPAWGLFRGFDPLHRSTGACHPTITLECEAMPWLVPPQKAQLPPAANTLLYRRLYEEVSKTPRPHRECSPKVAFKRPAQAVILALSVAAGAVFGIVSAWLHYPRCPRRIQESAARWISFGERPPSFSRYAPTNRRPIADIHSPLTRLTDPRPYQTPARASPGLPAWTS